MARKKQRSRKWAVVAVAVMALAAASAVVLFRVWHRRDPTVFVQQAIEACRAGQMNQALAAYALVYRETLDPRWYVEAGLVAKAFGNAQKALVNYDKAVAARENYLPAHQQRVELRLELVRQDPKLEGFVNLRKDAEALLALSPKDPRALLARGVALAGLVREDPSYVKQSLEAIDQAHQIAPSDVEIAVELARVREQQEADKEPAGGAGSSRQSTSQAEEIYRKLIDAVPNNGTAYLRYAQYLIRQLERQQDEAAARGMPLAAAAIKSPLDRIHDLLTQAERLESKDGEVYLAMATHASLAGQPAQAIEILNRAVQTTPDDLRVYIALAHRLLDSGQAEKARRVLEQGLARPFNRDSYRGLLDRHRRYRLMCMTALSYLAEVRPTGEDTSELSAKAEEIRRQAESELGEDHWMGRFLLGRIHQTQGLLLAAAADFRSADKMVDRLQDVTDRHLILSSLADVEWRLEQYGPLQETLNEILKDRPNEPFALARRSWVSLKLGRARIAAADAASAIAGLRQKGGTPANETHTRPATSSMDRDWIRETARILWVAARLENLSADSGRAERMLSPIVGADIMFWAETCWLYGRDKEAEEGYLAAARTDPTLVGAIRRYTEICALQDRRRDALDLIRKTLEALRGQADARTRRVNITARANLEALLAEADPNLADEQRMAKIVQALSEIPDQVERALALADYHLIRGQAPQAVRELSSLSRVNDISLLERRFAALLAAEDWEAAKVAQSQAAELNADGARGRVYEGRKLMAEGQSCMTLAQQKRETQTGASQEEEERGTELLKEAVDALRAGAEEARGDSKARVWLGQALAALGVNDEARDAFQMALVLNPLNPDAHRELARLAISKQMAGLNGDVHLSKAIRLSPKGPDGLPLDPWLHVEAQDAYELLHPNESIRRREAWSAAHPRDAQNLLRLAGLYRHTKKLAEADRCASLALEAAPKDIELHVKISRQYQETGRSEQATKILDDLASRLEGPARAKALLELARHLQNLYVRQQALGTSPTELRPLRDRADRAFADAIQIDSTPQACEAAADFCILTRRNVEAVKWLRQATRSQKSTIDERAIRQKLIRTMLEIRPLPEDMEREIGDYDARFQGYEEVSLFWGIFHAARGELDKAVQKHTSYLERLLSPGLTAYSRPEELPEAYYLRGNLYLRLASVRPAERVRFLQLAIEDLTRAKAHCPKSMGWHRYAIALALAQEQAGRDEAARAELQAAFREYPDVPEIAKALIELLGRQERWGEQEAFSRQLMSVQPKEWRWPHSLGQAAEKRKNTSEAESAYRRAAELCDYGAGGVGRDAVVGLLRLLTAQKRFQEVINVVEGKTQPTDRDYAMWAYYAGALDRCKRTNDSLTAWIAATDAAVKLSDFAEISQILFELWGQERAVQTARQLAQSQPGRPGLLLVLAMLIQRTGKSDEALQLVEQGIRSTATQNKPTTSRSSDQGQGELLTYGGILWTLKNQDEKAVALYEQALAINEDNTVALNNLAYVLSERMGRPREALKYAQRAAELMPDSVGVFDTLGWCLTLNGEYEAAVGVLSKVPARQRIMPLCYHLAETYRRMSQKDSARQVAEEGLKMPVTGSEIDKTYRPKLLELLKQL